MASAVKRIGHVAAAHAAPLRMRIIQEPCAARRLDLGAHVAASAKLEAVGITLRERLKTREDLEPLSALGCGSGAAVSEFVESALGLVVTELVAIEVPDSG